MPRLVLPGLLTLSLLGAPLARAESPQPVLESAASSMAGDPPRAAASSSPIGQASRLQFDWALHGSIAAAGAVTWLIAEGVFKRQLAPAQCVWCDRDALGSSTLSGVDVWGREARWPLEQQGTAAFLSDVTVYAAVPAFVLGMNAFMATRQGGWGLFAEDALIIAESAALAMVLNQGVKFMVGRERPFVAALPESERPLTAHPEDNNLSFFSGHASFAFSLAVAAGMVAELRGYENRHWVWAIGLPLAAMAPYLRMASDRHYLSDVGVGMVSGAAFGVLVPLLLHGRVDQTALAEQVRVVPSGDGLAVVGTF